jgi:Transglycosylase SLT domain
MALDPSISLNVKTPEPLDLTKWAQLKVLGMRPEQIEQEISASRTAQAAQQAQIPGIQAESTMKQFEAKKQADIKSLVSNHSTVDEDGKITVDWSKAMDDVAKNGYIKEAQSMFANHYANTSALVQTEDQKRSYRNKMFDDTMKLADVMNQQNPGSGDAFAVGAFQNLHRMPDIDNIIGNDPRFRTGGQTATTPATANPQGPQEGAPVQSAPNANGVTTSPVQPQSNVQGTPLPSTTQVNQSVMDPRDAQAQAKPAVPQQQTPTGKRSWNDAFALVESNYDPKAYNTKSGASGEMQVRKETAEKPGYGITPARDNSPAEYLRVGQEYRAKMQELYGDNAGAAAYNMGPGAFEKWRASGGDFNKLPLETQKYVAKVGLARDGALTPSAGRINSNDITPTVVRTPDGQQTVLAVPTRAAVKAQYDPASQIEADKNDTNSLTSRQARTTFDKYGIPHEPNATYNELASTPAGQQLLTAQIPSREEMNSAAKELQEIAKNQPIADQGVVSGNAVLQNLPAGLLPSDTWVKAVEKFKGNANFDKFARAVEQAKAAGYPMTTDSIEGAKAAVELWNRDMSSRALAAKNRLSGTPTSQQSVPAVNESGRTTQQGSTPPTSIPTTERMKVISPTGKPGTIAKSQWEAARLKGYREVK